MNQTVSIFGATGAQGAPVVKEALALGKKVRALARNVEKIRKLHPEAQAMALNLADVESITRALDGVEAAFVHLPMPGGPNDQMTWLDKILGAAQKVNLPLLVYSTSGPAGDKYPGSAVINANTAIVQKISDCALQTIILQPALYLENLLPALFAPRLRTEGIADYPPLRLSQQVA